MERRSEHTFRTIAGVIPVYPKEISTVELKRKLRITKTDIHRIMAGSPCDSGLAERNEGDSTLYCFPTKELKRRALRKCRSGERFGYGDL